VGDDHIKTVFQIRKQRTDAFAQTAFYQIADYGPAYLFADRETDAFIGVPCVDQRKVFTGCPHAAVVYIAELPVAAKPVLLLQS
jgi:hypothetical protein